MSNIIEILKKFKEFLKKIQVKEKIIGIYMTFLSLSLALLEKFGILSSRTKKEEIKKERE
jgi:hypothetical protein